MTLNAFDETAVKDGQAALVRPQKSFKRSLCFIIRLVHLRYGKFHLHGSRDDGRMVLFKGADTHDFHFAGKRLEELFFPIGREAEADAAIGADLLGNRNQLEGDALFFQDLFRQQGITDGPEEGGPE